MKRRDWILGTLSSTLPLCALGAQSGNAPTRRVALLNASQRKQGYHANLTMRGEALSRNQFKDISNRSEWEAVRSDVHEKLRTELGLPSGPRENNLHAQVTSKFSRDGYSVENIVFQSSPGLYVTGNIYLPATAKNSPVPVVVYVCGHSPNPLGAKISYQHHALWFVKNGFAAFVLDTIEFGEISGIHHGTHNLEMWHWLSLGYNPAGVEVWNAMRALDYLESRPEVDSKRAAVTGRSGGGAVSWYAAAMDERFQVASPVHGTWTVGPHIREFLVRENCDCIYVWNSELLDLTSIGALIAPRPLMIVNGLRDECFPPVGYRDVERQLKLVYGWYGEDEKLATFEEDTTHQDTFAYRKATNLWISRWLTGNQPEYSEDGIVREADPTVLRVLDGVPEDARNEGIDRTFVPLSPIPQTSNLAAWETRASSLRKILSSKLLHGLGSKEVPFATRKSQLRNWTDRYADAWNVQFATEEELIVNGQLFIPKNTKACRSALVYVKGHDDLVYGIDYDDILSVLPNHAVLVLRPRAVDYGMSNAELAETKMSAALLGTTLETLQLHDVLRSVDFLLEDEKLPLESISVFGRKEMGMVALYAGAVQNKITRVIVDRPPASHWDGPAVMHALRYTDLPEVAALIAPREITFVGRISGDYALTERICALYSNGKLLRTVNSLGDAMREERRA